MSKIDHFNSTRRRTLKAAAGVTLAGVAATSIGFADVLSNVPVTEPVGEIVDCKLLFRDDGSRVYLLMHNKTDSDIVADKFLAQTIRFEGRTLNMAEAFSKRVSIRSQDRILVQLNHESELVKKSAKDIIDLTTGTRYPTVGTRVVELPVRVYRGAANIDRAAVSFS